MFRTDYSPNRLEASKQGLLRYVLGRVNHDANVGSNSSFGLVIINKSAKKIFNINDNAKYDQFSQYFKSLKSHGTSALGESIGKAIKILIEDLRTNGARSPKILIISDGKASPSKVDPIKMANLSQQLGMKIDTIRIGEVEHFNILKQISDISGGIYNFADNTQTIERFADELAVANIDFSPASPLKSKNIISRKVLKKIAAPLLSEKEMRKGTEDQKSLIARLRGTKSFEKCSICFQSDDPISKTNFSISGRYCPNCATPLHISCASMWAKNQDKQGDGTVFRCVHCLYLLKIPASVQTAVRMHQTIKKDMKYEQKKTHQVKSCNVKIVRAKLLGDSALYSDCPVCNSIFEENDQVVKCGNNHCNAIYHKECFEKKLINHICKSCGTKLITLF